MEAIRDYFHNLKVEGKVYPGVVNVRLQDNMIYLRLYVRIL